MDGNRLVTVSIKNVYRSFYFSFPTIWRIDDSFMRGKGAVEGAGTPLVEGGTFVSGIGNTLPEMPDVR